MTKYIYKGQEISHTKFLTICQMAGVMGGRKKSHYEKLVEMAEQGNERAQDIEVVEPIKKITWGEYYASEQNTYLDEDNAADQDVVYTNDLYEVRVFKAIPHDAGHYFTGEDEDFVIVDSKDGSRESFLIYGCTLEDAINYIEE